MYKFGKWQIDMINTIEEIQEARRYLDEREQLLQPTLHAKIYAELHDQLLPRGKNRDTVVRQMQEAKSLLDECNDSLADKFYNNRDSLPDAKYLLSQGNKIIKKLRVVSDDFYYIEGKVETGRWEKKTLGELRKFSEWLGRACKQPYRYTNRDL